MKQYFATFVTGAEEIVAARLQKYPNSQLKVQKIESGLAIFDSELLANQLSELRFFNNVYELLQPGAMPQLPIGTKVTVRARTGSQPSQPPSELTQKLIAADYEVVAHRPETELLYWQRDDGRVLWGHMLPRPGFKTRNLEQGELRPELAHILGLVASVDPKDAVLDPFAGYGAIPREMLAGFHCQKVLAVEHNEHLVPHLKSIPNIIAVHGDAGQLAHIETRSIDRVVTDPPWGDYGSYKPEELSKIYHAALIQMHRVLRAKGCVVMLTAVEFMPAMALENGFTVEKQYPILVSGNKATIYKLRKA